jgi:isoleucyl-tRNA synthetase
MRWMYCRHNPAANIDFGPDPADELRAKFILKLWNTYAFFCNYARLDGFDPNAPLVPVNDRPDIDRWILSDLQQLVQKAHESFRSFNVMAFCLEAEDFVDSRLSNWYVRRNRRRFWKSEQGADKLAAYQTLYAVLVTLTKLFSPVMPFLSEEMYRNLVQGPEDRSVHLADYPKPDYSLIDEPLSADMEALLRLVSLGSAARNQVKIKVRQPLAEMRVQPGDQSYLGAVERFSEQIREELNLKKVALHNPERGSLLTRSVKANPKTLGPRFGSRLQEVMRAIESWPRQILYLVDGTAEEVELACPGGAVSVTRDDLFVRHEAPEGWVGVAEGKTQVAVDARITEELKREGMARDIVRLVQELRKQTGLEVDDRIILSLATESAALGQAIDENRDYVAAETLTVRWSDGPLGEGVPTANIKVDGQALTIQLRKV